MAVIPLQIAQRSLDTGGVVQYGQGGEIGRDMQSAGSELSAVAERIQARDNEMDKFKRITVEHSFDQATANQAAEAARNGSADGAGLHDAIVGQVDPTTGKVSKPGLFDTLAQQFRSQVPESQRGYFDASLPAKRLQLSGSAASAQFEQEQKYATLETTKIQNNIVASILQMSDPSGDKASFAAYKEQGRQTIMASPLTALAKQAALEQWDQASPKALAQAISAKDPGKLRQLFGMAPPTGAKGASANIVATDVIPAEGAALLNTIAGTESSGAYDVINGGEKFTSFADHPKAGQHGDAGIAAGRYQDLPSTWDRIKTATGVPDFSARSQDIGNWWLAQSDYKSNTGRDLLTDLKSPDANVKAGIRRALSSTWKGLENMGDGDFAASVGGGGGRAAAPKHTGPDLPIVFGDTAGRVSAVPDMKGVHPEVIERFKTLQNALGESLPVVSGFRDPARNERAGGAKASQHIEGNALDLDVRGKSQAEQIKIIQEARAQGFGGIGVYGNSIHIDTGPQRAWGASHHSDSLPMWARHALDSAPVGQASTHTANAPIDPRFVGMSPDDMLGLANQDDVAFRQKQTADVAQAKVEYTAYKDHLELGIRTGAIRDPGLILGSKLNEGDQASLYEMLKTENKDSAGVDAIIGAIGAGQKVPVNGFDSNQTKIADKAYTQFQASLPEETRGQAAAAYVASTGYIPGQVQAQLQQGAASTDPQTFANAMSAANTLQVEAPTSFNNFSGGEDVRKKLATYQHLVNDRGMSGEDAARRTFQMEDPAVKVNREALKPALEKFMKTVTVSDVTGAFDPGIFSSEPGSGVMPVQSQALLAEYRNLAEDEFYQTNGDAGAAKARALTEIKAIWNVSNISGSPNLMRMPPELHYPKVDDSYDYLRTDAMKTATEYATPLGRKVDNVAIVADGRTRSDIELKRPPRYQLFYQYTDGAGQTQFDQVYTGGWGIDPKALNGEVAASGERAKQSFMTSRAVNNQANKIERDAAAKVKDILADPSRSDFIKARDAEAEMGAARFKAQNLKDDAAKAAVPPVVQRPQNPRGGGDPNAGKAFRSGSGGNS